MASYELVVNRVDNRLVVKVNGSSVYDKYVDFNPPMNDRTDISNFLQPAPFVNKIEVEGFNGPTSVKYHGPWKLEEKQHNPWEFQYSIVRDGVAIASERSSSYGQTGQGNARMLHRIHSIIRED